MKARALLVAITLGAVGPAVVAGALRAQDTKEEKPVALKAGDAAPDFKVKDHEGREVTLASLKGKRFVLWFFPKADTPG